MAPDTGRFDPPAAARTAMPPNPSAGALLHPGVAIDAAPAGRHLALDPRALATLAQLDPNGNVRLIEHVLKTFVDTSDGLRRSFEQSWQEQDLETVFRVAHTFKSSAAIVGALALSTLSGLIENAVRRHDHAGLPALVERFGTTLDDALGAVRARIEAGR